MTKVNLQYDIVNLTPADAIPVENNYNRLEQHINQEVIERDGSVGMRAELLLYDDPVQPLGAATKQYVDQVLPIGIMVPFGGTGSPPGGRWLACDGAEYETAALPDLYAVIGTAYVTGTVTTGRFNVPDMRDRTTVGASATRTVGSRGGSANAIVAPHTHPIDHTHPGGNTEGESADHTHYTPDHLHGVNINSGGNSADHYHPMNTMVFIRNNPYAPAAFLQGAASGWAVDLFDIAGMTTNWSGQSHYHNISGSTGGADRSLQTGGRTAGHLHYVKTPAFAGTSGAASGAAASVTDANLPPYVATNWIIRAA